MEIASDRDAGSVDQRILHHSARQFLEALARRGPLCVVLEDIHWEDDALLGLIDFVALRAQDAALLIIARARPELLENE
jgi:predicted ATPase